ncbi:MAG: hypothetical protein O3A51_05085 [Verrucomicrobia bacterium]|nr:hypothetical protein [Verrucomicrobiota bacterium]
MALTLKSIRGQVVLLVISLLAASTVRADVMEAESAQGFSLDRVTLSGDARLGYVSAGRNAGTDGFDVRQFHLFFDATIAVDLPIADYLGLWVEWDFIRRGENLNELGDAYAELTAVAGQDWLNARVGRFQVPFGEEYTWFSAGTYDNPLAEYSVIRGYGWDEGIMLFGELESRTHLSYTIHVSDGESQMNKDSSNDEQFGAKLSIEPHPAVYLSGSILTQGQVGSSNVPAEAAWSFGGYHPGGGMTGPLDGMDIWEINTKVRALDGLELWGAYGEADIDYAAPGRDRQLEYVILQLLVEGTLIGQGAEWAEDWYGVARYSRIETADPSEGYRFLVYGGFGLGVDIQQLEAVQLGLGYRLAENAKIVLEYDLVDVSLIAGSAYDAGGRDMLLLDLAVRF